MATKRRSAPKAPKTKPAPQLPEPKPPLSHHEHSEGGWIPPLISREERPERELLKQLADLGHLTQDPTSISFDSKAAEKAIKSYQDFHGLIVDGELGPKTRSHMNRPRCGLADILPARGCISKWGFLDVMVSHRLIFDSMSAEEIHKCVLTALKQWNDVCGLRLTFQQEMSTANIWMEAKPIDQSGGTLAWSYLPDCGSGPNTRLQQRYDTREQWRRDFLIAVATHELGHAIGLDHSSEPNLMAPFYNPSVTKPQAGDIAEAVKRYGAYNPTPIPPIPPTVPPTVPPTIPPTVPGNGNGTIMGTLSLPGIGYVGAFSGSIVQR